MNLGRIINAFAQLNPFGVKVLVENNQPFAYRNVFGLKISAGPKVAQRAVFDFYAKIDAKPTKINKAMIGSPLGFVNQRDGALLNALLVPGWTPEASPVLRVTNPTVVSSTSKEPVGVLPEQAKAAFSPVEKRVRFASHVQSRFIEDID